jgi:hypothetical protein
MPEALRDDLRMHAGLQREGCVRVTQIVQTNSLHPDLANEARELLRKPVRVDRTSELISEDEVVVLVPSRPRGKTILALALAMLTEIASVASSKKTCRRLRGVFGGPLTI